MNLEKQIKIKYNYKELNIKYFTEVINLKVKNKSKLYFTLLFTLLEKDINIYIYIISSTCINKSN